MALIFIAGPTIAQGQSLSNVLDCSQGPPVRFTTPPQWTSAVLTFQCSSDNVTFHDLFDLTGREITVNVIPNTVVRLSTDFATAPVYLKFRSGTRDKPVNQAAARTFGCAQVKA